MTDICERRVVKRRESDASHALAAFVAEHRSGDGSVRIALRLPVLAFATWKSAIERRGVADFYSLQSSCDHFPTFSVTWSTRDGGLHPFFAGALAVERVNNDDDCVGLVLCGNYVPPLGRCGALFDAVVGQRIAHATVRDLLSDIAAYIEALPMQLPVPAAPRPVHERGSVSIAP
jgi:hypothetical protein